MTGTHAAIYFEPDGYDMTGAKLMGRQAAGFNFLRAAVAASEGGDLWAYAPQRNAAEVFAKLVLSLSDKVTAKWCAADNLELLSTIGTLYVPVPNLANPGNLRLRAGAAAYSICGVTHTTATHNAMEAITSLLSGPVMPWDALICTSTAVKQTVDLVLEAEIEYLRWRFGRDIQVTLPQLPVIPLGVHCQDYNFSAADKQAARAALGIAEDEIAILFAGRLSFHAKAHPHAMYAALQAVAEQTGKSLVLVQSGWFHNPHIEAAFKSGGDQFCPAVRCIYTDGKSQAVLRQSWAATDIFMSLSDNIQETFGLTPIEAMAAGLPCIVTDWNGYKDTIRDGIDGYRIPTWMPQPGLGEPLARAYETGSENYDMYCGLSCQTISVDMQKLVERMTALVNDAQLRTHLGQAGRARAQEVFAWDVVYRGYQDLWQELTAIRRNASKQTAPKVAAARLDPYLSFQHYPTHKIQPTTRVTATASANINKYQTFIGHALFSYGARVLPPTSEINRVLLALAQPMTVAALAQALGWSEASTILVIAVLAKMGLVNLS